jgi:hypothetical protein
MNQRPRPLFTLVPLALALALACGEPPPPAPAAAPQPTAAAPQPTAAATPQPAAAATPQPAGREPASAAERDALVRAEGAARRLGGTLRERLQGALATTTPAGATAVCADEAQRLTAEIADELGLKVGRASLRLRSPANAPTPWVDAWLRAADGAPASAAAPLRRITDSEAGPVARVILPIAIEPPCLSCHGPEENIDRDVKAHLAARYPGDAATGYDVGQLRGALWAEALVDPTADAR